MPVAAGLGGGGSSDAAAALRLANGLLETPLATDELDAVAASLGADVPFFLRDGPQLGTGDGTTLARADASADVRRPARPARGRDKELDGGRLRGLRPRVGAMRATTIAGRAAPRARRPRSAADLAALPPNDLASSPLSAELRRLGAFRADVTGAGPVVYGLFVDRAAAERARDRLDTRIGETWIAEPR